MLYLECSSFFVAIASRFPSSIVQEVPPTRGQRAHNSPGVFDARNHFCNALTLAAILIACGAAQAGGKSIDVFNGKDLSGWKVPGDAKNNKWKVGAATLDDKGKLLFKDGGSQMVNFAAGANIYTEQEFGDCLIELEVMVPKNGNSGIYLMGRYEIQVFDSFGKEKLGMGHTGAVCSICAVPKVNACKKPGEWQKFVIDFIAAL